MSYLSRLPGCGAGTAAIDHDREAAARPVAAASARKTFLNRMFSPPSLQAEEHEAKRTKRQPPRVRSIPRTAAERCAAPLLGPAKVDTVRPEVCLNGTEVEQPHDVPLPSRVWKSDCSR